MAVTVATLEAKARIDRSSWDADKAAIRTDLQTLAQELDQLSSRAARPTIASPRQAAASTASRLDTDSDFAQAKGIQQAQNDYRLYVRTLGEAHAVTVQARTDLEGLMRAAGSTAPLAQTFSQHMNELKNSMQNTSQGAITLKGHVGDLARTFDEGQQKTGNFKGGLEALAAAAVTAGLIAIGNAAVQVSQQVLQMGEDFIRSGIQGNAAIEQYTVSFKVLLGSTYEAQKRIADLTDFANKTPFNLPEVVRADRVLQTFGGTALATGKNLSLVGDIAAGTGRSYEDVALWVGRTYDALQSGRPWGEAALRLQEMGALSGTARQRLEDMQKSGRSGTEVWAAFNQEMAKFNGLMDEQSQTAAGLSSTLQDLTSQFTRDATKPVFNDYKAFVQFLTSDQGQKTFNQTATDTSHILGTIMPLAIGQAISAMKPYIEVLNDVGKVGKFLDDTFGLFGHTMQDQAASVVEAAHSMSAGSHHAFSDIGDVTRDAAQAQRDLAHAEGEVAAAMPIDKAIAYANALRDVQTAGRTGVGNEGGPRDRRQAERDANVGGGVVPPPPGFNSWDDYNKWNSAHNAIIDQTNQSKATANIAYEQAKDQQFLAASLQAQNAQAQAQQAIEQLKVTDRTFLNGQVSTEITSTQLQTAINRVKLGNSQLQQAQVQLSIAQAQVANAQATVQATNSTLISLSVEAGTIAAQGQAALSQAQGNSEAFISATVKAEQAGRDFQDKLDVARKAAGLIDQTGAEKRAQEKRISAIEFVKQEADDAASIIRTGLQSLADLSSVHVPTGIQGKIDEITRFEDMVIQSEQDIAKKYSKDEITKLYSFSQAAHEGIGYFSDGVTALGDVTKLKMPSQSQVKSVLDQANEIVEQVRATSRKYKVEDLAQTEVYAQTGEKVSSFLSSTADAFEKIAPQRFNLRGQINLAFENIDHAFDDLSFYSKSWKAKATDDVRDTADNVAAIMGDLNTALDPLTKFNDLLNLDDSTIDLGIQSIEHALDRVAGIKLDDATAQRLKTGSEVLGSAFTGLKTAIDTIQGLVNVADATGTVDIGADLDQFFLTQVPAYASTWETAMLRIGNSTAAMKQRIGLPNTPAVAAPNAQGAASTGSGNNYYLHIDASSDPDIATLVEKIIRKQNATQGGPKVGG